MNLHYLRYFIKHYLVSTPVDILHSPFVFAMHQECIKKPLFYAEAETRRRFLQKSKNPIIYKDFGASGNSRTVLTSELARKHLKPQKLAGIMARLVAHLQMKTVVELGTSLGVTTAYLALEAKEKVYTIEACDDVRNSALETLKSLGLQDKTDSRLGVFDEVLPLLLPQIASPDMVFIDGNHTEEATLRYFEMALPYLHNDSLLVFDDIYWSPGMTAAWEKIKQDKRVTVTVDLFFIGIVSIRREQVKQDFKLRVF